MVVFFHDHFLPLVPAGQPDRREDDVQDHNETCNCAEGDAYDGARRGARVQARIGGRNGEDNALLALLEG